MADTVVPMTLTVPDGGTLLNKPAHFVKSSAGYFLTLERPTLDPSYVHIRGFELSTSDEQAIVNGWQEILKSVSKSSMVEKYIPWRHVHYIQNLVYKAK